MCAWTWLCPGHRSRQAHNGATRCGIRIRGNRGPDVKHLTYPEICTGYSDFPPAMNSDLPGTLPRLWCDLNAQGWSGEPDDDCYYALDSEQLEALRPVIGMKVFIWDWSDSEWIVGREASLERFGGVWRARPTDEGWVEVRSDLVFASLI
jgi:hypothetical protein